jgi:hypothetical protein
VCARPLKGGPSWKITNCVATHMCRGKKLDGKVEVRAPTTQLRDHRLQAFQRDFVTSNDEH